jgi:hypothetical protein
MAENEARAESPEEVIFSEAVRLVAGILLQVCGHGIS